ncbi:hypothetical protein L3Q82_004410 [Scortum barcoo]|uniref:Uncharacterized protein n=1 Tax=Scortum barcoo TaxID=214431 RepID=A0ACB8VKR8_9TELE|nr:hypothetical protein L3Q82_004410 [Scortum barcoo]
MLAGKAYMERHNQVAGIVYRNICTEFGLEVPRSKWATPPKVVENDRAKNLWDFQIQTDKQVMVNQPDIVVVDKEQIDVAIPSDSNIRKTQETGEIPGAKRTVGGCYYDKISRDNKAIEQKAKNKDWIAVVSNVHKHVAQTG